MIKTIPFKTYISKKMSVYQVVTPLLISIFMALIVGTIIFFISKDNTKNFGISVAPHIKNLLETQDRTEIQRFLKAVSTQNGNQLEVILDNEIIASSVDSTRIGKNFSEFSNNYENTAITSKANIVSYFNLNSILMITSALSLIVFLFCFIIINWLLDKVINVAKEALNPLNELEMAIRALEFDLLLSPITASNIEELENIRKAFVETHLNLKVLNEKLAKTKAKEMSAFAYKNLIHDLHVPVAALRNHLKILDHERATVEDKTNAHKRIVDLAEQVLKQVKSARTHLGLEISLKEENVIDCIKRASNDAQIASFDKPEVEVKEILPLAKILNSHDPILLGRAITNLVTNAIEAANKVVEIECREVNDALSIFVSDDGKGLELEEASLQLQGRGKSSKAERLGIGLASANHIVRSHGGKIIYHTSPLGGACFEVRLQGATI